MRDGTQLAVTVWVPDGRKGPISTVLRLTRYWREVDASAAVNPDPIGEGRPFVDHGLAWVAVDARGTGASFGSSRGPWAAEEIEDYREVIDWVIAQPWSNGRVAATGISYEGNTALMVSKLAHPALKAIVPRFYFYDPFSSVVRPGGVLSNAFLKGWSDGVRALDANSVFEVCMLQMGSTSKCTELSGQASGVKPVDGPDGATLLKAAVTQHKGNVDIEQAGRAMVYRDDAFGTVPGDELSAQTQLTASSAAWMSWVGWLDAATVSGALQAWRDLPGVSHELVIGSWNHGGAEDADPFREVAATPEPTVDEQTQQILAFLDAHLNQDEPAKRVIRYSTFGETGFRQTTQWPPASVVTKHWAFTEHGALTSGSAVSGSDVLKVDRSATTGPLSRWRTPNGGPDVDYGDRRDADQKLLTFTSPPVATDTRITGTPHLDVWLSANQPDADVFAYLEDVGPDGRVTYLSEVVRRLSLATGLRRANASALAAGEVRHLSVDLEPVSALIKAGHQVRVALAGSDADSFENSSTAAVELHVERGPGRSELVLPIDGE